MGRVGLTRWSIGIGVALLVGAGVRLALRSTDSVSPGAEPPAIRQEPAPPTARAAGLEPADTSPPARDDDEPKPFFDSVGEPSREFIDAALEAAISEHLPSIKLSSEQRERLTESVFRLREAQRAMRELPPTPEHAEQRRALRDEIASASAAFEEVVDMTPGEFTASVQPGVGIDTYSPVEEVPEPEYLEDLR